MPYNSDITWVPNEKIPKSYDLLQGLVLPDPIVVYTKVYQFLR